MPDFSWIDWAILMVYFAAILTVGLYFGRKEEDTGDFFVGGRKVPWPAVLASIIATEVSAATYLAVPGVGFAENMNYLQFGIGSILARFFVASVFLGLFYAANCHSIYQYLGQRFGPKSHTTASLYFLLTRLMASGVRLMIAATGFAVILGLPFGICLAVFTVIALIYTFFGGIKAVIWTDCVQAFVFLTAGIAMLWFLGDAVGWSEIIKTGSEHGRFEVLRFKPDSPDGGILAWLNDPNLFFIAVLFGFISTTAALGTDQDMTQRMLTCKNVGLARRSIILSGFIAIPVAALFLFVGIGLFVFYQVIPDSTLPMRETTAGLEIIPDKVFSHFIANSAPVGLRGLLLAGVLAAAMSSLDSAMAALSASATVDLCRPLLGRHATEKHLIWISRVSMIFFALFMAGIAWILQDGGTFLWLAFKVTAITYSALLGVFLLGALTQRGNDHINLLAMLSGASLVALLLYLSETGRIPIGWTWFLVLGTAWTFLFGLIGTKPDTAAN